MASQYVREQVALKWTNGFARLNRGEPGITGLLTFTEAWILAREFLRPRDINETKPEFVLTQVKLAFELIGECKMLQSLVDEFLEEMKQQQFLITQECERFMSQYESTSDPQYIAQLVMRLQQWYQAWQPASALGTSMMASYTTAFQTHLFSILPPSFPRGFKALISVTFNLTHRASVPQWLLDVAPQVEGQRPDLSLWVAFDQLGFLDRYDSLVSGVCHEYVEEHILETCAEKWDEPMLAKVREWMANTIVPWMMMPYGRGARTSEEARSMLQAVGSRFDFHLCKTLSELRIKEIFDIIVDYPDSMGALQDLKECLQRVDDKALLVSSLRKANHKRLLHPGADTKLILSQYVSIIRCLRVIDPVGVLLFKVADPIRRYLRERQDTIRCIVASLVGDGESGDSLVDDSEPIQPLQQPQADDYTDPQWEPEPIDAGPEFRTNKPSDVISTLVSIYDSKELFVKELQVLLAQRLLAVKDGNYDKERRNIEILKIRFGEASLQVCEVMLKDMTDSRRIDQHVQAQQSSVLHPTIISKHFWPPLQTTTFDMPGQLKEIQERYSKEFVAFKPDKKLSWLPLLGTVKLEIELDDRTIEIDASPLEAAFVELFSQKDVWTLNELIDEVGGSIDRVTALRALSSLVLHEILKESPLDTFNLLNTKEDIEKYGVKGKQREVVMQEEATLPVVTVQQQQAEQMQVFWKFIEGMLKNLGTLPLDRIQQMLKFAPDYDRSIDQLGAFMEAARQEGLVNVKDGFWSLSNA
ncbi:Anaphase-promoting complex subunit 2 [Abortiporus biennis]